MITDDSLWDEFAAESEEHLDQLERLLSSGARDADAVNTLFRAFHSLKGMSDVLGAHGMRAVAHRAEDLLGLARAGKLAVSGAVADALIAAVDSLRGLRARVMETRSDHPADPALLARLAPPDAAPQIAPQPAPAAPEQAAREGAREGARAGDPLLGAFASRCAAAAHALATLSVGRDGAAVAEATDLAAAARVAGFPGLAVALDTLATVGGGEGALAALGRVRRLLQLLAARAGESAGADAIPHSLPSGARGDVDLAPLAAAASELAALTDPSLVAAAARDAAAAACALGLDALERTLLALEDLADRAAEPDVVPILAARGAAIAEVLHRAIGAPDERGARDAAPSAAISDSRVPPAFAALLSETARRRIAEALEAGAALYVARLAVGQAGTTEAAIAEALRTEGEILGSRSLPNASPPLVELLLASAAGLDALSRAATAADPSRRVLLSLSPVEEEAATGPATSGGATMRVRQETLDGLIALEVEVRAASLTLAEAIRESAPRAAIARLGILASRIPGEAGRETAALAERLRRYEDALETAESRLALALRRLDEAVLELRVVPVGTLLSRLPRAARAVAEAGGKAVDVVLEGQEVALDRSLVETLADPLLHLVRNAVDHGVETPEERAAAGKPARAVIRVSAARRAGGVRVRVSDDGAGIHRDRVLARAVSRGLVAPDAAARLGDDDVYALLFRPGFSTAETITATSGRGVGLDIVQDAVQRAGGTLEVASVPGQGTSFTLRLPLSAATQEVLLVDVSGQPYAIPLARVVEVAEGDAAGREGEGRPLLPLAIPLGLPPGRIGAAVVVRTASGSAALGVDRLGRRAELLLRPLHPAVARLPGVGGVGVLGDGTPVLLLDPESVTALQQSDMQVA